MSVVRDSGQLSTDNGPVTSQMVEYMIMGTGGKSVVRFIREMNQRKLIKPYIHGRGADVEGAVTRAYCKSDITIT